MLCINAVCGLVMYFEFLVKACDPFLQYRICFNCNSSIGHDIQLVDIQLLLTLTYDIPYFLCSHPCSICCIF
ncbi:hypothetical protein MPTK1_2g24490 [Marchantia polymorpha subsp. ruderalis]|uniref:Uncharacterized protein n=1 Tax=Marchantia polymorpha TaxID=3197 RepID=A0A2R6VZJ1_MARPO|nr:hypothetical protein MARPO_0246s0001 [Marchantia polymorpha]PTQ26992.1 hypothetical protein MARPO_0246s0001 [Marchantia polymorpha]BBN03562.1 hypothetical protein Mp_2g24490 [Marchantia polymorpha subsp. ruderalis]BBN03563.1 hypothetical protein Mp_2g24490 [Marchantia polymorpha subsp. ruderalis]|eukprot:PTQ26991.1 hypothetical protein MARPO_0246s0001 [Marchantia polymorpha]